MQALACVVARVLPSQVQNFVFVLVEYHKAFVIPFLQLVKVMMIPLKIYESMISS